MKLLPFILILLSCLSGMSQLERVVLDTHTLTPHEAPEGYVVYRLYAELENSDDYVRSISAASGCAALEIKTTGDFYNTPLGGAVASSTFNQLSSIFPELMEDSYLTIGIDHNYIGSDILHAAVNLEDSLAFINSFDTNEGTNLILQSGGIANVNHEIATNGFAVGPENRVLLAQLTTNGEVYFKVNLDILVHGDPENLIKYFWQVDEGCGLGTAETGYQYNLIAEYYYCSDPSANNYVPDPPEDGIQRNEDCEYSIIEGCSDPFACNYSQAVTSDDGSCEYPDGCTDESACNYLISALCDDGSCFYDGCTACTNPQACNYDDSAIFDDGSCQLPDGCTDEVACNYAFWADCDNGSCEYISCEGCVDEMACNFDLEASIDDGSCEYLSCSGCTDSSACNFDPSALIDNGTCNLPDGCTDESACNYLASAICDDGSCEFQSCLGCTDEVAVNYESEATIDDGSCIYPCSGEMIEVTWTPGSFPNEASWNLFVDDGTTAPLLLSPEDLSETLLFEWCLPLGCYRLEMLDDFGDGWNGGQLSYVFDGQNMVHTLSSGDDSFDIISIGIACNIDGCTNSLAENFNPMATIDDGSCIYESVPLDTEENELQIQLHIIGWQGSDDATINLINLNQLEPAEFRIQDVNGKVLWEYEWIPLEAQREFPLRMLKGDGWYLVTLKQGNQKVRHAYLKLSSG